MFGGEVGLFRFGKSIFGNLVGKRRVWELKETTDRRRPILGFGPGQLEMQVRDQSIEGGDEVVGEGHCFLDYN